MFQSKKFQKAMQEFQEFQRTLGALTTLACSGEL
jgi:hypothetical protein